MSRCNVASNVRKSSTIIGDLPNDILHRVLELMPIQDAARTSILSKRWTHMWSTQPHLVFDRHFFQYVSNKDDSVASIIHRILMQHTGPILGFHLISKIHELSQSDVDQCIIFFSKQGIQKLTLDLAKSNDGKYSHGGSDDTLILPLVVTLKLRHCTGVDRVCIVAPKIETLSILSSYTVTFQCFNLNPIFTSIKHLCLNGTSLEDEVSAEEIFFRFSKIIGDLKSFGRPIKSGEHVRKILRSFSTIWQPKVISLECQDLGKMSYDELRENEEEEGEEQDMNIAMLSKVVTNMMKKNR
ncbi:putative F-box/FBD/LRR-repeat protein At5g52460 [Nicotiana tomentosiformis]|uniref:putative F-box/FBD/LRR-repeat protein At5g52460 n=1 Tax=Nicotiana tomentosiformis TaxID=4098 RepID=UPI00388C5BC4